VGQVSKIIIKFTKNQGQLVRGRGRGRGTISERERERERDN
jgi:hypothetical protein